MVVALEKYRIQDWREEGTCLNCGCPLHPGDTAFVDEGYGQYCSTLCVIVDLETDDEPIRLDVWDQDPAPAAAWL